MLLQTDLSVQRQEQHREADFSKQVKSRAIPQPLGAARGSTHMVQELTKSTLTRNNFFCTFLGNKQC